MDLSKANMTSNSLQRFLNSDGQITQWPAKQRDKLLVLEYLADKFEADKIYTELEINEVLKLWHTFMDWPLLRRGMVDMGLLSRDRSGREYHKVIS